MESLSQFVARYALTKKSFPTEAIDKAKTFILDSLGVGIAGAQAPFSKIVYTSVQKWGAGDDAHIWGRGERRPQASAAYLNGFQIHSMEFDCVHEPAVVHPMATILAALGSEADKTNCSGQAFLEAIIIAVDIAVELGVAATSGLKFFRPATAGLFGATLGIARLRGLDQDTTLSAMGCALAQTAGVMQAHVEGKPTLPVQIAGAARAAVVACDLAEAGLEGPVSSLAGPYGYFAMFEDQADMDSVRRHLGQIHRITEVSWKPFPTGRAAQGGIVCVQDLRKQGLTLANLKHLTLSAPPIIHRLVAREAVPDMTANYARLCFAYLAAMTLKTGSVSLQD
ncbi:MAG TPA: MmgE/PrpD family protein, partial [Hellea balneolensis]|nr:MmgE/PrpD family protein [Hellea balneolensis]